MCNALANFICCAVVVVGFTSSSGNAHSPDISSGAYIGCFRDIGQYATFAKKVKATRREPVSCRERCRNESFTYIGLWGGMDCWCASGLYERRTPNRFSGSGLLEKCNASCADNSTLSCGGFTDEVDNTIHSIYSVCQKTKYGKNQCKLSCNCKDDNHCSVDGVCPGNECAPGWNLNVTTNRAICNIDINECTNNKGNCSQQCNNSIGSYECRCYEGYELESDHRSCKDVDECSRSLSECNQNCTNTIGSYSCSCFSGFKLTDEHTCIDIDECSERSSNCDHSCSNTLGGYTCGCHLGFQLQDNGFNCSVVKADLESALGLRIGLISACCVTVILLTVISYLCYTLHRLKISASKKSETQPNYETSGKEQKIVSSKEMYEEDILNDYSLQTAQPNYESLQGEQRIAESNLTYEELHLNI